MYFCPRSVEPDFGLANLPYGYQNLPQTDICILVFRHNPFQVPNWLKIFSKHSFCTVHTLLSILLLFFSLLIYSLLNRKEHLSNTQELSEHQIIFLLAWPLQEVYQWNHLLFDTTFHCPQLVRALLVSPLNEFCFCDATFRTFAEMHQSSILANLYPDINIPHLKEMIRLFWAIVTKAPYWTKLPNITRSVDNVFTQSNVISDSVVSGDNSDILYRFSVDNLPLRYPFNIEPKRQMVFFLRSMTGPETCATLSTNQ